MNGKQKVAVVLLALASGLSSLRTAEAGEEGQNPDILPGLHRNDTVVFIGDSIKDDNPTPVIPKVSSTNISSSFNGSLPENSLTIIRIPKQ